MGIFCLLVKHSLNRLNMRYIAAYLLAVLGGNNAPSAKDVRSILSLLELMLKMKNSTKSCLNLKEKILKKSSPLDEENSNLSHLEELEEPLLEEPPEEPLKKLKK